MLQKRCSEYMQQIYRRTPLLKCDFNKVVLHLYWNRTSAWVFFCKFAIYVYRTFSYEHLWRAASVSTHFRSMLPFIWSAGLKKCKETLMRSVLHFFETLWSVLESSFCDIAECVMYFWVFEAPSDHLYKLVCVRLVLNTN